MVEVAHDVEAEEDSKCGTDAPAIVAPWEVDELNTVLVTRASSASLEVNWSVVQFGNTCFESSNILIQSAGGVEVGALEAILETEEEDFKNQRKCLITQQKGIDGTKEELAAIVDIEEFFLKWGPALNFGVQASEDHLIKVNR